MVVDPNYINLKHPCKLARSRIGLFLAKLYPGISKKLQTTIFGITKCIVRRAVASLLQAFMRVKSSFIGIEALT
jgi:hypothetical protein